MLSGFKIFNFKELWSGPCKSNGATRDRSKFRWV